MALEAVLDPVPDDATRRAVAAALAQEGLAIDLRPAILESLWLRAGLQEGVARHVAGPDSKPAGLASAETGGPWLPPSAAQNPRRDARVVQP